MEHLNGTKDRVILALKERGVRVYWKNGCPMVNMTVNNIPAAIFDEWMTECRSQFAGDRWSKIHHDWMKLKQFNLQAEVEAIKQMDVEEKHEEPEDTNPLGLLGE